MHQVFADFFGVCTRVRFGFSANIRKKALVLAPHSDDEAIGCAGTIFQLQSLGYEVVIVLFTLPVEEMGREDGEQVRLREFRDALSRYQNGKEIIFDFPDGELHQYCEQAKEKLKQIIEREEPGLIFTPYIMDYHSDHRCVSRMLAKALPDREITIAMYEVWVPILHPNYYIDISEFWDQKQRVLQCYSSQMMQYSILKKAKELNQLRASLSMRKKVKYVEAFKGMEAQKFIRLAQRLEAESIISH